MWKTCETSENRMYEFFNPGGGPFSIGSPGYLLHNVCNSSLPCGRGDHGYRFSPGRAIPWSLSWKRDNTIKGPVYTP